MPRFIVKLSEGERDWYLEWSTVVDAPVTFGMSLDEFKKYYRDEYGRKDYEDLAKRLERVEATGTSSRIHESAEDTIDWNRAGKGETCLSIQQIIDFYCKFPDLKTEEEWSAYQKNDKPVGRKHKNDD